MDVNPFPFLLKKRCESLFVSTPADPPVKTKPPSPPPDIAAVLGSDVKPNAASSPKEDSNGLDDSINGAPAKRPHSPAEEEVAKRLKDSEVMRPFSAAPATLWPLEVSQRGPFYRRRCPTMILHSKSHIPRRTAPHVQMEPLL